MCSDRLYAKLDAHRLKFETRCALTADLACARNFDVMARILLYGDLSFLALCDFNELRVAKISRSTTPK